jgi:hypothetical protein
MELDELKTSWEALSKKVDQQQQLTNKLIEQMTRQHYHQRINKIAFPEFLGTIVSFAMAFMLTLNFKKLDTPLLQVFGALSVIFLIVMPILSLQIIKSLHAVNTNQSTYADTLVVFAARKIRFQKFQQLTVYLSFLFIIVFMPVAARFFAEKDITQKPVFWLLGVLACVIFLLFFSKWVLKHYNNALKQAEALLKDVES